MLILNTILDIIFPINCISCGKKGVDLCLVCLTSAPEAERESVSWVSPMYDYRHQSIKKALWLLKYKGKKGLAKTFAEMMHGKILEDLSELSIMENFREPLLIPVPLSKKRYKERGYNQAELICIELTKIDNNENFELRKNVLIKSRDTGRQAHIENRSQRLKNIVGSFEIKKSDEINNRNIILIDDITTTGATLTEAKKVLKKNGAKKVIAFTVAH